MAIYKATVGSAKYTLNVGSIKLAAEALRHRARKARTSKQGSKKILTKAMRGAGSKGASRGG